MLDDKLIYKDILKGKILKGSPLSGKQLKKLVSPYYKKKRAKMFF
jgi:hypothetical protein